LEQPVVSEQALYWRLRGPVGVLTLAKAITSEAKSEIERYFLLTELCLELSRVRPSGGPGNLSVQHVRSSLRDVVNELRATLPTESLIKLPALADYSKTAFEEILK
jgi:hypothetical protein